MSKRAPPRGRERPPIHPPLALWSSARYISVEFPDTASGGVNCARGRIRAGEQRFQKLNERSPIHLSHAGSDQDLSGRPRRCWKTSICRSTRTPRSACSASTAPASRRCCASWPASTPSSPAKAGSREGARVGYLEQEPQLDPAKSVRENVMEGVAAKKALLDRYNEIAANYSDETADEMAKLQDQIDSQEPVGPRQPGRSGDGRAALPARRRRRDQALGRREAAASRSAGCCSTSPTCCCSTSRPTISTPRA